MALLGTAYAALVGSSEGWLGGLLAAFVLQAPACMLCTWAVVRKAHVRNPAFRLAVAWLLALCFLWARWQATFAPLLVGPAFHQLLLTNPLEWAGLWPALVKLRELLDPGVIWAGEALLVLFWCFIAAFAFEGQPYSELRRQWARPDFSGELWSAFGSASELKLALQTYGVEALLLCPRASASASPTVLATRAKLCISGQCVDLDPWGHWLDVVYQMPHVDAQGNVQQLRDGVVQQWVLPEREYSRVRTHVF